MGALSCGPENAAGTRGWLRTRLPLAAWTEALASLPVPQHRGTSAYHLGSVAIALLGLQAVTGVLLACQYIPVSPQAHASVLSIMRAVPFGWLVRSVHYWASHAMIAVVTAHMGTALLLRGFAPPREFTWWSGLALGAFMLAFGWTGGVLPHDTTAHVSGVVGSNLLRSLPGLGPSLASAVAPCDGGSAMLQRSHALHVVVLPFAVAVIVAAHVGLVRAHGLAEPANVQRAPIRFYPAFAWRSAVAAAVVVQGVTVASALWPAPLGRAADVLGSSPEDARPAWYFVPVYELLRTLQPRAVLGCAVVFGVCLCAVPLLGRTARGRTAVRVGAFCLALACAGLLAAGMFR